VSAVGGRILDLVVICMNGEGRLEAKMVEVKVPGEEDDLTDDERYMLECYPGVTVKAIGAIGVLRSFGRVQ